MVPAALKDVGLLARLLTDWWVRPGSIAASLVPRLRDRFHPSLDGSVTAFNRSALLFEASQLAHGASDWARTLSRNEWLQDEVLRFLSADRNSERRVLFSYSYAARRLFEHAKPRGWTTVMVQIDPGPAEELLMAAVQAAHPGAERWAPAPPEYWQRWREETQLADRIVVHSQWSFDALAGEGVPPSKLMVIPLAYTPPAAAARFVRSYPDRFTRERPLRVLFLGQVILRKGVLAMLEAARALTNEPIEFIVAGRNALRASANAGGRIRWVGSVPSGTTGDLYRAADVFLFPTLSDGFGLTQLEALAWRLPVIATTNCGAVVVDGVNGVRLEQGSGTEIATVLRRMAADPALLVHLSQGARVAEHHQPDQFVRRLRSGL